MCRNFSDGERQKAMIAKALAQQCPIILLDEPTAFLDVTSRIETMVLLHTLAVEQQKAILLSTHDLDLAIQLGDCLWLQEKKRPMACGTPEDLIMGGAFETFFSKEGIVFDPNTGKLNTVAPTKLIGVAGDFMTSYWVGNALIRNGFKPSSVSEDYISVYCNAPDSLRMPEQRRLQRCPQTPDRSDPGFRRCRPRTDPPDRSSCAEAQPGSPGHRI